MFVVHKITTNNGTEFAVDDTEGKHSVCVRRWKYEAELDAMVLNSENNEKNLYHPFVEHGW